MLAIRLQRTGRKGHAQFRLIVQEARRSPSSGNVVAALGSYDPHTKVAKIDSEKASFYLTNGAQPSQRVALLLQKEGVKLPSWVSIDTSKQRAIKNSEKLRRNRSEEPAVAAPAEPEEPKVGEATQTAETTEDSGAKAENSEPAAEEATEAPAEEASEEQADTKSEPAAEAENTPEA